MKAWIAWIGLMACACSGSSHAPAEATEVTATEVAPKPSSASTRLITVEVARGAAWLDAPARTIAAPDAQAVVSVPLPARVTRVRVRPGDVVETGAALVDVVMPELVRAAGALVAAKLRLEAHAKRLAKLQPLVEQGLARAVEVADIEALVVQIQADRETARATLRAAGVSDAEALTLTQSANSGGALSLRAPIAGTITAVHASIGQYREPASGPLLEITRGTAAQVEARFLSDSLTGFALEWIDRTRVVPLAMEAMSPSASKPDGARVAWLHPSDPNTTLPADLVGRVRLVPPTTWMALPARAVGHKPDNEQSAYVMRLESNELVATTVTVELIYGDNVLVTGIEAGARVLEDVTQVGATP